MFCRYALGLHVQLLGALLGGNQHLLYRCRTATPAPESKLFAGFSPQQPIILTMTIDQRREQPVSRPGAQQQMRTYELTIQPKSWISRLLLAIVSVAVMAVTFFLSIIAFAVLAGVLAVAAVYFLWATRHVRRALRERVIEGEVKSRDIHE